MPVMGRSFAAIRSPIERQGALSRMNLETTKAPLTDVEVRVISHLYAALRGDECPFHSVDHRSFEPDRDLTPLRLALQVLLGARLPVLSHHKVRDRTSTHRQITLIFSSTVFPVRTVPANPVALQKIR